MKGGGGARVVIVGRAGDGGVGGGKKGEMGKVEEANKPVRRGVWMDGWMKSWALRISAAVFPPTLTSSEISEGWGGCGKRPAFLFSFSTERSQGGQLRGSEGLRAGDQERV